MLEIKPRGSLPTSLLGSQVRTNAAVKKPYVPPYFTQPTLNISPPSITGRTIFDILPTEETSKFHQLIPPTAYDLLINNRLYTVVKLRDFTESDYLREALYASRAASEGVRPVKRIGPLKVNFSCDMESGGSSQALVDALFLAIAYRITTIPKSACLTDYLCLMDIGNQYQIGINYDILLKEASKAVKTEDDLFLLANATSTYLDRFGVGKDAKTNVGSRKLTATLLGQTGSKWIVAQGDTPDAFEAALVALMFAWMPLHEGREWKQEIASALGRIYPIDSGRPYLTPGLMASYVENMVDVAIEASESLTNAGIIPFQVSEITQNPAAADAAAKLRERIDKMYRGIHESLVDAIRAKVASCILQWVRARKATDIEIIIQEGPPIQDYDPVLAIISPHISTHRYSNLYYDVEEESYRNVISEADKDTFQEEDIYDLLSRSSHVVIRFLTPTGISYCNDQTVPDLVNWPIPRQYVTYKDCVMTSNILGYANETAKDKKASTRVLSINCCS